MRRLLLAAPAVFLVACTDGTPLADASAQPAGASVGAAARVSVGRAPPCVSTSAPAFDAARCARDRDALDDALDRVHLERCGVGLESAQLNESLLDDADSRMLGSTGASLRAPLALPPFGEATASSLDASMQSSTPVTRAILTAAALRKAPLATICADDAWYAPAPANAPLAAALAEAQAQHVDEGDLRAIPLDLQLALVPIVRAIHASSAEVVAARGALSPALVAAAFGVPSWILGVRHFAWSAAVPKAFDEIDATRIARAAARLALVVESANLSRFKGVEIPSLDLATPAGPIILRGPSNDTFTASGEAPAFLLDTGGDDTYVGAVASGTRERPVSILVDLGGRDTYSYREVRVTSDVLGKRLPSDGTGRADDGRTLSRIGRQGSGVLGVGLLVDLGSDADTYRSLIASQGAGSHGVGVLFDAGGSDRYEAEGFSQGAAAWGVGLLLDEAGNDEYRLYNSGQGFGFTRGVGAIVDAAGDDIYVANPGDPSLDGDPLYRSDQLPGPPSSPVAGNHSFAQGVGAGHRPDWPDPGYPFPGGLGILRDSAGRDRYVAGVFAQGAGFVQGMGMLLEGGGDDTYRGLYYVQGAAAHMAVALFHDHDGADDYNTDYPIQLSSIGLAHDFSVAIHYDEDGNDRYKAPALSLGTSLANGISLFVNDGGEDQFEAPKGTTFGMASTGDVRTSRKRIPTVGVFVKARGESAYHIDSEEEPRGGQRWCEGDENDDLQKSVGLDAPRGRAHL